MKLTDESKQKLFDTYNQLIKSYGQEHVLQKIKRKMYNYMQRNKLDRATAFIMAVKVTAHETKADPSPITPASTRTTDGGKGNGNFEHKECFGQVEGSSKAGGTLKTESVTVDFGTIDEGDRVNRKMLLDVVDALIDINRKLNKVGKTGIKKSAGLGLQEVADAVRDFDKRQEFDRVNAELDKKIQSLKETLGI